MKTLWKCFSFTPLPMRNIKFKELKATYPSSHPDYSSRLSLEQESQPEGLYSSFPHTFDTTWKQFGLVQLGEEASGDYWVGAANHPPMYRAVARSNCPNVNTTEVGETGPGSPELPNRIFCDDANVLSNTWNVASVAEWLSVHFILNNLNSNNNIHLLDNMRLTCYIIASSPNVIMLHNVIE